MSYRAEYSRQRQGSLNMEPKIGIVLGATRGIGRALVDALARQWANTGIVYLTARRAANGEATVAELATQGVKVRFLVFDLTDRRRWDCRANRVSRGHESSASGYPFFCFPNWPYSIGVLM
jgi:NAD(P)-dependent dehydrogenase (short-subunit alcohol dehydrogenase family)